MVKPTLLILAAGLSSRYSAGLKQLDSFGPAGETLLDYAIYDAIRAGFFKIVFVIRKIIKDDFQKQITSKYNNKIECDFVFQELDDLPPGFKLPAVRQKPWGTGHAVWAARKKIKECFAVINADDFYGIESYKTMAAFLKVQSASDIGKFSMIGFNLLNTLSDHGSVSRGLCNVHNGKLVDITERTNVFMQNGIVLYTNDLGLLKQVAPDTTVSMNFWGFSPDVFQRIEHFFKVFLKNNISDSKSEFYLPNCVNEQIKTQNVSVQVLTSSSKWIGVTFPEDKNIVQQKIKLFVEAGEYPSPLF